MCTKFAIAQESELVKFKFRLNEKTEHELVLSEFLERDVPQSETSRCSCTFEFFYFRINRSNKVDSIYHEGTLKSDAVAKIITNIKKTEGHWLFSEKSFKDQNFWFVYPYFDFGGDVRGNSNCSLEQKVQQKCLIQIAENIDKTLLLHRRNDTVTIQVAKKGGPYGEL